MLYEVITSIISGVHDAGSLEGVNVYPNPASDFLIIDIDGQVLGKSTQVAMYDINGNMLLLKELTSSRNKIDISGFASGLYILNVRNDNAVTIQKIIKK